MILQDELFFNKIKLKHLHIQYQIIINTPTKRIIDILAQQKSIAQNIVNTSKVIVKIINLENKLYIKELEIIGSYD